MNTAASPQDQETMKWTMTPSEFFSRTSYVMKKLEEKLARSRKSREEKFLELYRAIHSI